MSLVSKVGRKRPRARFAMAVLYLVLTMGAITTLYPFAVMMTTGFKGPTDQNDTRLIPAFWTSNDDLLKKYRDDKYAGDMSVISSSAVGANATGQEVEKYDAFLRGLEPEYWKAGFTTAPNQVTSKLTQQYQIYLRTKYATIDDVNKAYLELNTTFSAVAPPNENLDRRGWNPTSGAKWEDYVEFKRTLPTEFRVPVRVTRIYQEWMRSNFANQFDSVPADLLGSATTFEQLTLPADGEMRAQFLREGVPIRYSEQSAETLWAAQHSTEMPIAAHESAFVAAHSSALRTEMSLRNYRYVLTYMLINGRALVNTAIFCLLVILIQLTVNPLAAYALSRYPMPATAKILLFLLATMAFPAEVAMIPSFLLLKDMHLLNTFWALVLPGAANGYMIFLLKGFFDSLPNEIFESGQLDGAREGTMLWKLALPLSKPVLGYLALLAFMGAYGSFMYAFLVAQDQRMWTLMVFIYQLQQSAPKAVMMAAVTLAAVPTLLVFLFAQRTIMKGIVLPGEK
ncbi:MAG: carbohydrate ABC transporter permease [Fimbriimonadaceae bacterium]|nr:carbohydrate ABC transporter permease [Fimbriimonadaceae bacterium]